MSAAGALRWLASVNGVVAGYVVVVGVAALGRLWWPAGAFALLGLATAVVLAAAPVLYPVRDPVAWLALAASAVLFTTADVIYTVPPVPAVRLADVLYVPAYALAVLALGRLARDAARSGGSWDAGVLATGLAALGFAVLAGRSSRSDARNLSLLYPLADLVILALSARLAMASRRPPAWLLVAGAIWLVASGLVTRLFGYPVVAWLYQTLQTGFLACWGLAALWPPPQRPAAGGEPGRGPPVWPFALVVLLVPAALLIKAERATDTREVVLAVACAIAGLFVVARLGAAARATAIDPVTGLVALPALHAGARAQLAAGKAPTLFLLELEELHVVSETAGRRGADEVLRRTGRRLRLVAGGALVARGSPARFAVLATLHAAEGAADRLAADLTAAVTRPVHVDGQRLHLACRLGYATAGTGDADDLMVSAEAALHAARNAGPGARVGYHPGLREAELERATLTADLREAIGAGQLLLEYQPIVDLDSGLITGLEALVRWQHPRLGRLGPDRFVPLAESQGLIGDLGAWVLSHAVAGAAALNAASERPVLVHVNVSPAQFGPRLARELRQALGHAVDPAMVVLEVTETMLGPDRQRLADELRELKATGARVALDDFGTGYSSLARLQDLPIDIIKIDKMFVTGLVPGAPAQMIAGILQIAASLSLDVVAEGIEQASDRDLLAALGCRLGQGYLYSQPIGLAQAQAMIQAGPLIR